MAAAAGIDLTLASKLSYGLGGKNHVLTDTSSIAKGTWTYADGFSDGEYVTISMEADSGTSVTIFRDNGFTTAGTITFTEANRRRLLAINKGGNRMLIKSDNGTIRKLMAEHGYFESDWKNNV